MNSTREKSDRLRSALYSVAMSTQNMLTLSALESCALWVTVQYVV
jgi:hypothetical protein